MASRVRLALAALLGAAIGAGVALAIVTVRDESETEPKPTQTGPVVPIIESELARRFRPVLLFDSGERWRPLRIDLFLSEEHGAGRPRHHQLCEIGTKKACEPITSTSDFVAHVVRSPSLGVASYLDIVGNAANGLDYRSPRLHQCEKRTLNECDDGDASAIYYNITAYSGRIYIDYWWFLRYNDFERYPRFQRCRGAKIRFCFDHEGDWEGITVITFASSPDDVEYVAYASHEGIFRYSAAKVETRWGRPVVYVARGSHASYPKPCARHCKQLFKIGPFHRPEGQFDGRRPWTRNTDEACFSGEPCLIPFPRAELDPHKSWNAWSGLWGELCSERSVACLVEKGPRSPSWQRRYQAPWCFGAGRKETCDAPTPGASVRATPGLATKADCRAWLGLLVAMLACDEEALADSLAQDRPKVPEPLKLTINSAQPLTAEVPGVVQAILEPPLPLDPGDEAVVSGPRKAIILLVARARVGRVVIEFEFDGVDLGVSGKATVSVRSRGQLPVVELRSGDGSVVEPTSTKRIS
jgi:hypothetical protein